MPAGDPSHEEMPSVGDTTSHKKKRPKKILLSSHPFDCWVVLGTVGGTYSRDSKTDLGHYDRCYGNKSAVPGYGGDYAVRRVLQWRGPKNKLTLLQIPLCWLLFSLGEAFHQQQRLIVFFLSAFIIIIFNDSVAPFWGRIIRGS